MTLGDLINRLKDHFPAEDRGLPDSEAYPGRTQSCVDAVNAALQFLFSGNTKWSRRGTKGFILHAPTDATVTVTQGSDIITFAAWQDWFNGCCIRINGASYENRIHGEDEETGVITLCSPHDGASGTVTATIYHDSIDLPVEIGEVLAPVELKGVATLVPAPSVSAINYTLIDNEDYDFHHNVSFRPHPVPISASAGIPHRYCVDSHLQTPYSVPQPRLRIYPAPNTAGMLETRVRFAVPVYNETDEMNVDLPIPHHYCESILIPVAEKYLTRSPFFRNQSAIPAIDAAYVQAVNLLRTLNPQGAKGMRLRSIY